MRKRIYIETTIISYLTACPSRDLINAARQEITSEWWKKQRTKHDLYISQEVLNEAANGNAEAAALRVASVASLPLLDGNIEVENLATALIRAKALPKKAASDAFHLALAAHHGMDILLTWNYRHLANADLMERMADQIRLAGYHPPLICTPESLMGGKA